MTTKFDDVQIGDTRIVTIDEFEFRITMFDPFEAVRKFMRIKSLLVSALGDALPEFINMLHQNSNEETSPIDVNIDAKAIPIIKDVLEKLDEDTIIGLISALIIAHENIHYKKTGEARLELLDENSSRIPFSGNIDRMILLCAYVLWENYSSFLDKAPTRFGKLLRIVKDTWAILLGDKEKTKSKSTAPLF